MSAKLAEQQMQGKINNQTRLSGSIFWVSLGLSAIFWVVDSTLNPRKPQEICWHDYSGPGVRFGVKRSLYGRSSVPIC